MGEMQRILDIIIDPALQMIVTAAEEKEEKERRRGRPWDRKVFVLNGLTYIAVSGPLCGVFGGADILQSVLEPYSFTSEKRKGLEKLIDERVHELTEEHVRISSLALSPPLLTRATVSEYPPRYRAQRAHPDKRVQANIGMHDFRFNGFG
jgi:hypothetical protein